LLQTSIQSGLDASIKKDIISDVSIDSIAKQGKAVFSKEEIYRISRPDCIINKSMEETNDAKQKLIEALNQKIRNLDSRVNELEVFKQKKTQENDQLRAEIEVYVKSGNTSAELANLENKYKVADERYKELKKENDYQWGKLMESEKKVREL